MEKEFIYYQRGVTAHAYMMSLIERDIVPMISVESLSHSRVYKECDKWLLSNGYKRVFANREGNSRKYPYIPCVVWSDRYEYYKA